MTTELVASILTTNPAHCFANRNVMLMVRSHSRGRRHPEELDAMLLNRPRAALFQLPAA